MDRALLLPGRYVALDFETTGLDPTGDRIVDVGAVECVDGRAGRTFRQLVDPGVPIPPLVTRLTGLRDEDVAGQPSWREVRGAVEEFLGDDPVLAHNAAFERDFLTEGRDGVPPPNRFLDTIELAGLVRAEDPRRGLDHLARALGVRENEVHRGLEDAVDCLEVALRLLESIAAEGRRPFVDRVLAAMAGADWSWAPELRHLASVLPAAPPWRRAERDRPRVEPADEPEVHEPVTAAEIEAAFAGTGPLAGGHGDAAGRRWEARPQQVEMAREVAAALSEGRDALVEAPTGTGKSLAYLVPAAIFARRNREKVVIATHTRNLQDQLGRDDLPRAAAAAGEDLRWRVVKGQENYLCTRRTLEWLDEGPDLLETLEERSVRAYAAAFLERTADGDLEGFTPWFSVQGAHVPRVVDRIRSTSETCLHERCPHFRSCFYQDVVFDAREADVLVVNHALALAWPDRYPAFRHLVVDEAHAFEDAATQAFAVRFEPAEVRRVLNRVAGDGRGGGALGACAKAGDRSGDRFADPVRRAALVDRARAACATARAALPGCVSATGACLRELHEGGGGGRGRGLARLALRLTPEVLEHGLGQELIGAASELARALEGAADAIRDLLEVLERRGPGESAARDLARSAERLSGAGAVLLEAVQAPRDGHVYWLEAPGGSAVTAGRIVLTGAPVSVAELSWTHLFEPCRSVVLTSATLTAGDSDPSRDGFVTERTGLDRAEPPRRAELRVLPSPFDPGTQLTFAIPSDLADLSHGKEFEEDVARVVTDCGRLLGGRTLALFAANRRRDAVGEIARRWLEPEQVDVLVQGRGLGRDRLVRELRAGGRKVVLGSRSLWEGIDVPGPSLVCVVIEKLPFDFPWDPLHQAREQAVREAGGHPFLDYTLPRALVRFRQGVGRLVRSKTDRGVVLLLQSNLYRRRYRSRVEKALPGVRVLTGTWDEIRDRIPDLVEPAPSPAGADAGHGSGHGAPVG